MPKIVLAAMAALTLAAPAAACPNWQASPSFGAIELSAGFLPDPFVRDIKAGGGYDLAACSGVSGMSGSVASAPDFDLYWSGSSPRLTIAVNSTYDTVLLISPPSGPPLFSDDVDGFNPIITIPNPQPGLYDIWVGSYEGGSGLPGQLIITER